MGGPGWCSAHWNHWVGWKYQEWLALPGQEEAVCCWLREKEEKQEPPTVVVENQHQSWLPLLQFLDLHGPAWLVMFLESPKIAASCIQVDLAILPLFYTLH